MVTSMWKATGKMVLALNCIFLQARMTPPSPARSLDEADYKGNGERILIVDDLDDQREIVSNILSTLGYSVSAASSGEDAISYLSRNTADLVILDMLMPPGMDGLETFENNIENQARAESDHRQWICRNGSCEESAGHRRRSLHQKTLQH